MAKKKDSKPLSRPSLEKVLDKIGKLPMGPEIALTVVSDYKKIKVRDKEIIQPSFSQFKIEIMRTDSLDFVFDLLRRIHETTPIVEIRIASVYQLEHPKIVREYINFLRQACPTCPKEEPCEKCSK